MHSGLHRLLGISVSSNARKLCTNVPRTTSEQVKSEFFYVLCIIYRLLGDLHADTPQAGTSRASYLLNILRTIFAFHLEQLSTKLLSLRYKVDRLAAPWVVVHIVSGNPATPTPHITEIPQPGVPLDPIQTVFKYASCVRVLT